MTCSRLSSQYISLFFKDNQTAKRNSKEFKASSQVCRYFFWKRSRNLATELTTRKKADFYLQEAHIFPTEICFAMSIVMARCYFSSNLTLFHNNDNNGNKLKEPKLKTVCMQSNLNRWAILCQLNPKMMFLDKLSFCQEYIFFAIGKINCSTLRFINGLVYQKKKMN